MSVTVKKTPGGRNRKWIAFVGGKQIEGSFATAGEATKEIEDRLLPVGEVKRSLSDMESRFRKLGVDVEFAELEYGGDPRFAAEGLEPWRLSVAGTPAMVDAFRRICAPLVHVHRDVDPDEPEFVVDFYGVPGGK